MLFSKPKKVTIIAVDRAEARLGESVRMLEKMYNLETKRVLLVNNAFRNSPAYKGNETGDYFKEIVCDFSSKDELTDALKPYVNDEVIFNCRMEESFKDYQRLFSFFPKAKVQSKRALENSTEKSKMRRAMVDKYPEISPKFIRIEQLADFNEGSIASFKYPVMVKPNGLYSSFLVQKCSSYEEVKAAVELSFREMAAVYERTYGNGQPSLVIEEFMEGQMYSIDAYVGPAGEIWCLPLIRVITAAELGLDGYYSYRHIVPVDLTKDEIAEAESCARKAVDAVDLKISSVHVEMYKTQDGWKIIELAPRSGGYRQDLYYQAYGIEHYLNDLLIHYGKEPDITPKWHKHAAGFNIFADTEGVIKAIHGVEEAKKCQSVVKIGLYAKPGNKAVFNSKGGDFLVDGILSNEDPEQLEADMKRIRELVRFDVVQG